MNDSSPDDGDATLSPEGWNDQQSTKHPALTIESRFPFSTLLHSGYSGGWNVKPINTPVSGDS